MFARRVAHITTMSTEKGSALQKGLKLLETLAASSDGLTAQELAVSLGLAGCKKHGEHPSGDHPSSEHPSEESAPGDHPAGEHPK